MLKITIFQQKVCYSFQKPSINLTDKIACMGICMNKKITILYVEDETQIRENTQRPLNYLCDELVVASNGESGLELYRKYNPDIVVSDIKMPNMNGIDMCKAIKEIDPDQHIIFTTAHNESGYFMDAIDMQVDGYILKPIDYDLLENKILNIKKQINIEAELQEQKVLTKEITKLQDNLLLVLDKQQNMIFSNDNFLNFFKIDDLDSFETEYKQLSSLFLKNEELFTPTFNNEKYWVEEILKLEKSKRIVSLFNIQLSTSQSFLVSAITIDETAHSIIIFTDITDLTMEKKKFQHKAFTDALTGIHNRAYFNEILAKHMMISQREKKPFSFIILDIDRFKNINDTYGHQVGDEILKELVKIISKHTRKTDTFARWGGEEFVKILSDLSLEKATEIAEFIRIKIENHKFVDDLKVTCSFGVSQFHNSDTQESLIQRADKALYYAKENGRNRVENSKFKDGVCDVKI